MLEYRSELVASAVNQLISFGVVIVLWLAVFRTNSSVAGYSFGQMALYYLLIPFIGLLTQVQLSAKVGFEIKDGLLSSSLLKPFAIWLGYLMRALAQCFYRLAILLPFYVILTVILFKALGGFKLDGSSVLIALLLAMAGFMMHFFLDLCICWLSFWAGDVWSFQHFKSITFGILGGVSFPFEFLPSTMQTVFNILPFKFLFYVPLAYVLGKRGIADLPMDCFQLGLWILFFAVLSAAFWKKGVKVYEAYGN